MIEDSFLDEIPVDALEDERVFLRRLQESDSEALYKVIDESRAFLAEHLPWPNECSCADDVAMRIDSWDMQAQMGNGACWGVFEKSPDGVKLAGCIIVGWAQWAHRSASVSYWLGKPFTGRGLAASALNLVSRRMFELGFNRLEISVSVKNEKSALLARRCGYKEEGKCRDFERINGIFVDHVRFARLARDPEV